MKHMTSGADDHRVSAIRAFNRFYTRHLGLLEEGLLQSPFSLAEARIIFEVAQREVCTATELVRELGLDPGYLSRTLSRLDERGILSRTPSLTDGRQIDVRLTREGRKAFNILDQASRRQIAGILEGSSPDKAGELVAAMATITRILGGMEPSAVPYVVRDLRIGDIGWVIRRQGMLYAEEFGWDETFEPMVAEIAAAFVKNHDPRYERAWIAERDGAIVGSVFLVRGSAEIAKLRMLYVEPSVRGLGIGHRLVDECIAYARAKGYRTLTLWTNDILVSARRIYEKAGFNLVKEERHHSFGKDLVGQTWNLQL